MARTPGANTASPQVKIAAVRLVRSGMSRSAVGRTMGLSASTISRWWRLARKGGANALFPRPVSGRPRKLPEKDLRRLAADLRGRPSAVGLRAERWTLALVADLIRREFGVAYHPSHVSRLLRGARLAYD